MSITAKICVSVVCYNTATKSFLMVLERLNNQIVLGVPGGHVEFGETPLKAAKRELFEETGVNAENYTFIGTTLLRMKETNYFTMTYLAFLSPGSEISVPKRDPDIVDVMWETYEGLFDFKGDFKNSLVIPKINIARDYMINSAHGVRDNHKHYEAVG